MTTFFRRFAPLSVAAMAGLMLALAPASARTRAKAFDPATLPPAESVAGNYLAGLVASASRDTSAAAIFIREALKGDPGNNDLVAKSFETQLADGNMDDAVRLAQRIFQRDQKNGLARLVLGVKAIKDGRFDLAKQRVGRAVRGRRSDMTETLLLAWIHAGAKENDKAFEAIDQIKGDATIANFRDYHAGLLAEVIGRNDEAEKRLRAAYSGAGQQPAIRLVEALAGFEARRGRAEEARKILVDYDKKVSRHPSIRALLAGVEAGKPLARIVTTPQQGAGEVFFGLGMDALRSEEHLAAIVYMRLARYLDPGNDYALVSLAETFERLKLYDKAIGVYDDIAESSPLHQSAQVQIALNLETLKRHDEAIAQLQEAVAAAPTDIEAFTALGNILRARKRYDEAIAVFTKGLEALGATEPSHWSIYYYRGASYERAKQWPKAEADFKKAMELRPDNANILNYLGYSWVDQNMNLDEAFKMLKKAVELTRERDGYIVDSLGWGYYRLSQFDEAVKWLERAVDLRPSDPTINDHLGDAYWRVGRKLEASFQWSHARDILVAKRNDPDEGLDEFEKEELDKVLQKLSKGLEEPTTPTAADSEKSAPPANPNGGE